MQFAYKVSIGSFDAITNNRNNAVERLSFDAWGRRRNATDWTYNNVPATFLFDRGFTGHEHMDAFGLINANGRIYDPCMGRFLSPDNVVQSPDFTQDYNRYSYAINNPLKYTDPSGYTRPPAFETYWNEYVGLMQQGYERRLVADENAWLFFQWYVKDVNGKWIRRENAMDVTGKGDYVSRDEVYYAEGTGTQILLNFLSVSEKPSRIKIGSDNVIYGFLLWISYIKKSGFKTPSGENYHISDIIDGSTVPSRKGLSKWLTSIFGNDSFGGAYFFPSYEAYAQWTVFDRGFWSNHYKQGFIIYIDWFEEKYGSINAYYIVGRSYDGTIFSIQTTNKKLYEMFNKIYP